MKNTQRAPSTCLLACRENFVFQKFSKYNIMENNLRNVRQQIKENSEELQDFIRDLGNWEKEIKKKDEELRNRPKDSKEYSTESAVSETEIIPKKADEGILVSNEKEKHEKELEEDEDEDEEEEEEEANQMRLKQKALVEKDKGNRFFSEGKFDDAIACYTSGIQSDPTNAVLPANRAMAFIKKGQLAAAEQDCTLSINLDNGYAKAFFRRGTCRLALKKLQLARQDFLKVIEMEPGNKFARLELEKLEEVFRNQDVPQQDVPKLPTVTSAVSDSGTSKTVASSVGTSSSAGKTADKAKNPKQKSLEPTTTATLSKVNEKISIFSDLPDQVKPVYKAAHLRSKKPLERLEIDVRSSDEESEELTIPPPAQRPSWLPTSSSRPGSASSSRVQTPSTPCVTPSTPKALPPSPHTAFQFEMDWRRLRHWEDLRVQYLKTVTPDSLKNMYKKSIETEMFVDIIHCVKVISAEEKQAAFLYLKSLTQIGRFSTTVLFLSPSEKQIVKEILEVISPVVPCEEMKNLQNLYSL